MSMVRSKKQLFISAIKWVVTLLMLWYVLSGVNFQKILQIISIQSPLIPIGAVTLIILQMLISTSRWQAIIAYLASKPYKPSYLYLSKLNFIGLFFNSCLPGTIGGDVIRAMLLRNDKLPLTQCAHSVILDRLMAVIGVFIMALLGLPWLKYYLPNLPAGGLAFAGLLLIITGFVILTRLAFITSKFPERKLFQLLSVLLENTQQILLSPKRAILLISQAILAHGFFCLAIWLLANGIGAPLTVVESLLLIPPVLLIIMLPISIGGWGIREVSMVGFLSLAGVSTEAALTLSVEFGLLTIIASLPGAWFYARHKTKTS